MESFGLSLLNCLNLPFAQPLGYAVSPGAIKNVGGTFAESLATRL
jgi:hypothetical protein